MNKKLMLSILCISLLQATVNYTSMILPQDETGIWKWSPFRMGSHLIWGKKLGQDFWESNASELKSQLAKFKAVTKNEEKTQILQDVLNKSAEAYQNVIKGLEANYRTAMSYIVEQFQNESPDSTILYLPDNKLVTMYKKDASDQEKAKIMLDLLRKADDAMKAKKSSLIPDNNQQSINPITINVNQPKGKQ